MEKRKNMDTQSDNTDFKALFAELLSNTDISSDASLEEISEKWNALNDLLFKNIPQKLFRFRSCSVDSFISLQSGTISLCTANSFKDKYDSLVYVNNDEIIKRITALINSNVMEEIWNGIENGTVISVFESIYGKEKIRQMLEEIYKYPVEERKQKFYESAYFVLPQIINQIKPQIDYIRRDRFTKIACFTEDVQSLYMWDTYADGYKGYALEYDFREFHFKGCRSCNKVHDCNDANKNFSNLFPIIYSNIRYDATVNVMNIILGSIFRSWGANKLLPPAIDQLFWYKAYLYKNGIEYGHEKEWRMITRCLNQQDNDFATISDLECLKAIYYGPNMEKRYKDFLREIARQKNLLEYDMSIDTESSCYELRITPLK